MEDAPPPPAPPCPCPKVYTREPDDADEYNFFSGARFANLGATAGVSESLKEMGIERPSHIQALSYRALSGLVDDDSSQDAEDGDDDEEKQADGEDAPSSPSSSPAPPQHVLLADQAGSGKTLAYLLPLLQRLSRFEQTEGRAKSKRPRLLILCPTSELVVQVLGVVRQLSRGGGGARLSLFDPRLLERRVRFQIVKRVN